MAKKKPETLPDIPEKKYFKISEIAKLTKVPEYTLRFWEKEFSILGPQRSSRGHRIYQKRDLELIFKIKHLLYENRFTINGAKKELSRKPEQTLEKPKDKQLELGFERNLFKDLLKNTLNELKEIEKQLGS